MIKKLVSVLLILSMLTLCACTVENNQSNSSSKEVSSVTSFISSLKTDTVPEVNDYAQRTYLLTEITQYLKLDGRWATAKTSAEAGAQGQR